MLTNSLKILNTTKAKVFDLIFFLNDQKISQKYCREDLSSVSDPLTFSLSISVLAQCFLGILVSPLFGVFNFRNH